jgi:MSHA biogenesis protein MshK
MRLLAPLLLPLAAVVWTPAGAQVLSDPTRPPGASASADQGSEGVASPVLRSILISPGRKLAVIGNDVVRLGGHVGDATLVKIGESEVTLRRGTELVTLKMYPEVEKTSVPVRKPGRASRRPSAADKKAEGAQR